MSSISSELRAKVKALQRDFPSCSANHILRVLLDQNQHIALARVHLALLKKEEDRIKSIKALEDSTGSLKTESPFALSKDRHLPSSLPLQPKSAPELPAKSTVTQDYDPNSSIEFSSSQKSDFATSSQSSASSIGITRQSSLSSIPKRGVERVETRHRTVADEHSVTRDVSPFALSKPSSGVLSLHRPKEKREITIPDLFQRSNMKEARLMGTNRAKRSLASSFFEDVMDVPEVTVEKRDSFEIVEISDEEVLEFKKGKRRKLDIGPVDRIGIERLSQILPKKQSTDVKCSPVSGTMSTSIEKPHQQRPKGRYSQASPQPFVALTSTRLPQKDHLGLELSWSDSEEEYDGSTTIGNDSNSTDTTIVSLPTFESVSRPLPSISFTQSLLHEPFHFSSQAPTHRAQLPRRNRILEDDDF